MKHMVCVGQLVAHTLLLKRSDQQVGITSRVKSDAHSHVDETVSERERERAHVWHENRSRALLHNAKVAGSFMPAACWSETVLHCRTRERSRWKPTEEWYQHRCVYRESVPQVSTVV